MCHFYEEENIIPRYYVFPGVNWEDFTFLVSSEFLLYVACIFVDCVLENHRKTLLRVRSYLFTKITWQCLFCEVPSKELFAILT